MKFFFSVAIGIALVLGALPSASIAADTYVDGYYRSNGSYVQPHYRSSPNNTSSDNWSTKGNYNPYTGQAGTKSNTDYYGQPSYGYGQQQNKTNSYRGY